MPYQLMPYPCRHSGLDPESHPVNTVIAESSFVTSATFVSLSFKWKMFNSYYIK